MAYWVVRNWTDVQDYFGISQPTGMVNAAAVPAPSQRFLFSDWKIALLGVSLVGQGDGIDAFARCNEVTMFLMRCDDVFV